VGGQSPLGYARAALGRLKSVEREAAIVRAIFREYPRRGSLGGLQKWLKERRMSNRGKEWTRQTLAWILRNPVYRGRLRIAGRVLRAEHPALVDGRSFARVQSLLAARCRNANRGRDHAQEAADGAMAPEASARQGRLAQGLA
jgi:hypothetical protein